MSRQVTIYCDFCSREPEGDARVSLTIPDRENTISVPVGWIALVAYEAADPKANYGADTISHNVYDMCSQCKGQVIARRRTHGPNQE